MKLARENWMAKPLQINAYLESEVVSYRLKISAG
jgi:hypothetical protein